jgi:hypothetical protein
MEDTSKGGTTSLYITPCPRAGGFFLQISDDIIPRSMLSYKIGGKPSNLCDI